MLIRRIENCTRVLGKSQGYLGLPIRDVLFHDGTTAMVSAWEPSPAEIEKIVAGASIMLILLGSDHPPVRLAVGDTPDIGGEG